MAMQRARFTQRARSGRRADRGSAGMAVDTGCTASIGLRSITRLSVNNSSWEPDGVTLQVRFCEEPGTNWRMAVIAWHRRETRRQTENTNFSLIVGKNPAYSSTTLFFRDRPPILINSDNPNKRMQPTRYARG